MAERVIDTEPFRAFEHHGWNRVHEGYHSHWEHLTTQAIPPMLEAAGAAEGRFVLDVASGPGYVSEAAASRGAKTFGLDISERMVELASQIYPDLEFQIGDAEALPFQDGTFDAVLINFGILHFPDPDKALAEAHRVLKTGGCIGFTAWAGPEGSAIGIAMGAIAEEGSLDVDLPAGPPIFRFADHTECERVLSELGFQEISCSDLMLTWRLPRPDALMSSFQQATARTAGLINAQDQSRLPAIQAAMTEKCRPYVKGDRTELPMPAMLTTGKKA